MKREYVDVIRAKIGPGHYVVATNRVLHREKETDRCYIILKRKRAYCHFDNKRIIMVLDELEQDFDGLNPKTNSGLIDMG